MSTSHSLTQLNRQVAQIADTASRGETVVITRHDKPYVVIVSVREYERLSGEYRATKSVAD